MWSGFLQDLRKQGLVGCNVTVPYKETAFAVAARKQPAARAVGAANTLWYEADTPGGRQYRRRRLHDHLAASAPALRLQDCAVSVLGAGGAGRAIVHALLEAGAAEVRLFNRTRERADNVARHFGAKVHAHDWAAREDRSGDVRLLVNATSLGMRGSDRLDMQLSMRSMRAAWSPTSSTCRSKRPC